MYPTRVPLSILVSLLLFASTAQAEDVDPRDSTIGAIHVKTNTQYASVTLNGESAEAEFVDDGKTIILGRLDRTKSYVVVVTGTMGASGTATVKVRPRDFKLVRVAKRVKEWRAIKRVRLKKAKVEKKPKDDEPEEDPRKPLPDDDEED